MSCRRSPPRCWRLTSMTGTCGELYGQAYAAFRRRRSVLLLNLEHQVQFGELPWIAALQQFRADAQDGRAARADPGAGHAARADQLPSGDLAEPAPGEMTTLATQAGLSYR